MITINKVELSVNNKSLFLTGAGLISLPFILFGVASGFSDTVLLIKCALFTVPALALLFFGYKTVATREFFIEVEEGLLRYVNGNTIKEYQIKDIKEIHILDIPPTPKRPSIQEMRVIQLDGAENIIQFKSSTAYFSALSQLLDTHGIAHEFFEVG